MEIWVLVIIAIRNKLEEAVKRAQNKIMKIALNPTIDALKQSAIISELINNKNMLVNLKILYDRIEEKLGAEDLNFLKEFALIREDVEGFCIKNMISPALAIEKVEKLTNIGTMPLKKLGLTVGKMEEDYESLPLVALLKTAIIRTIRQIKKRAKLPWINFDSNAQFSCVAI